MKKIIFLFCLIGMIFLTSCTTTSQTTCLTPEKNRYQAQDNTGTRKATCLTPDAKRYQGRWRYQW